MGVLGSTAAALRGINPRRCAACADTAVTWGPGPLSKWTSHQPGSLVDGSSCPPMHLPRLAARVAGFKEEATEHARCVTGPVRCSAAAAPPRQPQAALAASGASSSRWPGSRSATWPSTPWGSAPPPPPAGCRWSPGLTWKPFGEQMEQIPACQRSQPLLTLHLLDARSAVQREMDSSAARTGCKGDALVPACMRQDLQAAASCSVFRGGGGDSLGWSHD